MMAFPFLALGYWGALFELASSPSPGVKLTSKIPQTPKGPIFILPQDGFIAEPAWAPHPSPRPLGLATGAARARAAVMEVERTLGFEPRDVEFEKYGYDIESRVPGTGKIAGP